MRVLVACEESQVVCQAFRDRGHEAYSCDLLPTSGNHPEWHIQADALEIIKVRFDLIIAHPPCTYMSKAGARWMYPTAGKIDEDRLKKAMDAKKFFFAFFEANAPRIAVENPRPLKVVGLPEPTQIIQPWQFGDPYSKETLLWLKGLPELEPTKILNEHTPWMPSNTGGLSRGGGGSRGIAHDKRTASRTFPGIAKAMADQWGRVVE